MISGSKRKFDEIKSIEPEQKKEPLPPHARPISQLCRDVKESKPIRATHTVYPVKKRRISKPGEYRPCFFKEHIAGSELSQLEAYNAEICKLMATADFVPKAKAYYDDETQIFLGIGSHAIEGFKSNSQDPLVEENLVCNQSLKDINFNLLEKNEIKNLDEKIQLDENQLQNYRIIKGLAISLMTRYLFKEDDTHNCNLSKYGFMIDFDMTKWNILCHFKQLNSIEKVMRMPDEKTFKCTEHDIVHFPDIKDATPYYWPTKQTKFSDYYLKMLSERVSELEKYFISADDAVYKKISEMTAELAISIYQSEEESGCLDRMARRIFEFILKLKNYFIHTPEKYTVQQKKEIFKIFQKNILENILLHKKDIFKVEDEMLKQIPKPPQFFSDKDQMLYKKLTHHPVFVFYKYKTLLKYVLTDKRIYQAIATLHINPNQVFVDSQGQKRNLINVLVEDEAARIEEIKKVLLGIPEFKDFLLNHGKFAFELIKKEFIVFKQKYAVHLSQKPYYRDIVEVINLETMEALFKELMTDSLKKESQLLKLTH